MRPTTEISTYDAPPSRAVAECNAMADTCDPRHLLRISAHRLMDRMTAGRAAR
jgi:hypothetical protein